MLLLSEQQRVVEEVSEISALKKIKYKYLVLEWIVFFEYLNLTNRCPVKNGKYNDVFV